MNRNVEHAVLNAEKTQRIQGVLFVSSMLMFQPWMTYKYEKVHLEQIAILRGSQTHFSAAEEQGHTDHTLVPADSLGIQVGVCWRSKTGTPPDVTMKQKTCELPLYMSHCPAF